MMEQKKGICDQIKTLQSNLKNAEESFRTHNGTRGELDLMLAEAQMRFLREKRGSKSFWARQTFAMIIAVIIALVGLGSWLWAKSTVPAVANNVVAATVKGAQLDEAGLVMATKTTDYSRNVSVAVQNNNVAEYNVKENVEPVLENARVLNKQTIDSTSGVGTQEMRNLVRVARKKLSEAN